MEIKSCGGLKASPARIVEWIKTYKVFLIQIFSIKAYTILKHTHKVKVYEYAYEKTKMRSWRKGRKELLSYWKLLMFSLTA